MGPNCNFCHHHCFMPDPLRSGNLLFTCRQGKAFDREHGGYDIDQARSQQPELPLD